MINYLKRERKHKIGISVISLKTLAGVLCLIFVFAVCGVGIRAGGVAEVFLVGAKRELPIYCVDTDEKVVALSFDAAYGADKTEGIMKILKDYGATATFFLVGFWVDKFGDTVKSIEENGFEIGTHSNVHGHMSKMSEFDITQDLSLSMDKLEKITGLRPTVFRPPYGEYNDRLILSAKKLGLYSIQWSVDSLDWKGISAEEITVRVTSKIHEGAIVLFHNNSDNILEALPRVLEILKARGYGFKTVGELIYRDNYSIDNSGKQIKLA